MMKNQTMKDASDILCCTKQKTTDESSNLLLSQISDSQFLKKEESGNSEREFQLERHIEGFMDMDDAREIWETIRTSTCTPSTSSTNIPEKEVLAGFADENILKFEETNHALMAISSSNELGVQDAKYFHFRQAVRILEAQLVTSQKQQLSLNEKLTFQANAIHEKEEKLKRYRRIGMKAVKEKEQLQENNRFLERFFKDSIGKPLYSRFTKTNDFKGVPHPLSGDYTPKPQEEIDDSLYVYGKKGPQKPEISVSDDNSSEHSTCQSNDSEGSCGNTSEHSFETKSESLNAPNEMSKSRLEITNEKVVSELQEVEPSCAKHVKTPRQPLKDKETHKVNRKNWNDMMERELGEGYSFTKKKCFVCGSLSHLIKDCDYYEKKMAREAKVKRAVNTDNQDRDLVLRRKKKKSLDYNNSFLGEYECSSLALDREERRDEKEEIESLETRSNNVSDQEIYGEGVIRKKKKSLDYNNSFLGEYECSSLALDREERRDEKEEIESLETRSNNVEGYMVKWEVKDWWLQLLVGGEEDDKELVVMGEVGGDEMRDVEGCRGSNAKEHIVTPRQWRKLGNAT
ncbi:hypothetical protein Tco_0255579 [Tanacetum coccineum]